ncbi:MAG: DUF1697 domain-containing protein [Actinomycetota bacterium]
MARYLALLRGINVGGRNLIKMTELKSCFAEQGFEDVVTYIQSGNVVFGSGVSDVAGLTRHIERMLSETFDYPASAVLRSRRQMRAIVDGAPKGFGADPSRYRYDVIFLKAPLSAKTAIKRVTTRADVDDARAGSGVLYFSRLVSRASQSYLSKIVTIPEYQRMTIRNWNTTTKLVRLMEGS